MGIKLTLNPKNDQLVPINALKAWSENLEKQQKDPTWLDKIFGKTKEAAEKIGEINNVIKRLPAPTQEKGARAWFLKVFLAPFDGKVTDEAKEIFEKLKKDKSFQQLEQQADEYEQKLKTATTNAAKAAQALNTLLLDQLSPALAAFSQKYEVEKSQPRPPATSPVAPQAGAPGAASTPVATAPTGAPTPQAESISHELYQSKKLLELGFITENEYLAKLVEIKTCLQEASQGVSPQPQVQSLPRNGRLARRSPRPRPPNNQPAEATPAAAQATQGVAPEPAQAALPPQPAAQTPAPQGAGQQQEDPVTAAIKGLMGGPNAEQAKNGSIGQLSAIATGLQDQLTKYAQTGSMQESYTPKQKEFAKLHAKKQVLSEYIKTGEKPSKIQLNEFLLTGLLLAALAGALAWAAGKLGGLFKDAWPSDNSRPSHNTGSGRDTQKDLQASASALAAGVNAKGDLVTIDGKTAQSAAAALQPHITSITTCNNNISNAMRDIAASQSGNQGLAKQEAQAVLSFSPNNASQKLIDAIESLKKEVSAT